MASDSSMKHFSEPTVGDDAATGRLRPAGAPTGEHASVTSGIVHALPVPARASPTDTVVATWTGSLAVLAAGTVALTWAFREEIAATVQVWSSSATFGHAFFIVPISLFLFYRMRRRLVLLRPSAAPWACVPIAILTVAWVTGEMANLLVVKQFAIVGLWQALFLLVLGWRVTRAALFPLLYLYFAVPFGSSAIPALQDVTAQMVVHLLRLTGTPVFLDGYLIQIPSGSFLVAEACSGVRYLIVSIALGVLAAHLFITSWPRRLFFIGLSISIPLVANGIRAYGIVILAHLTDYRTAADFDHVLYGFVFLGVITLSVLGLAALLRDRRGPGAAFQADTTASPQRQGLSPMGTLATQAACCSALIAVVFVAQAWTAAAREAPEILTPVLVLHDPAAPWQTVPDSEAGWKPRFQGSDVTLQRSFRLGSSQVDLHVAYYAYQREGAEAISDVTNFAGAKQWRVLNVRRAETMVRGEEHPYVRMLLASRSDSYVVWYWYRIGGQNTNSRILGKLLEARTLLSGDRAASIVAIGSRVSSDVQETDALLADFLNQTLNSDGTLIRLGRSPAIVGEAASP